MTTQYNLILCETFLCKEEIMQAMLTMGCVVDNVFCYSGLFKASDKTFKKKPLYT